MNKEKALNLLEEAYFNNLVFMTFMVNLTEKSGRLIQISRESIRPLLTDLKEHAHFEESGLAKNEDYIWKSCCKSLGDLKYYRFIDDNDDIVIEILLTTEENAIDNSNENLADQMLDLYTSSKTKGIYTLDLRYDDVYEDDTDYIATYPGHIYTDKEREEFFKDELKDYTFLGECKCVYYAWTGLIKDWNKYKYYKFMHSDGLGHMEVVVAPINAAITDDEELEDIMINLEPFESINGDLWIKKTEKGV